MIKEILQMMIKPIIGLLIKKAIAHKYYLQNNYLVYEIELINYWISPKSIDARLIHAGAESVLSTQGKGTILLVKVPVQDLGKINEEAELKLTINNKSVWITKSTRWDNFCESILIEKNYITTTINKRITIAKHFKELTFISQAIPVTVDSAGYNSLVLAIDDISDIPELNQLEIYAFNHDKFVIFNGAYNTSGDQITISDFQPLLTGLWRLFFKLNGEFYPLEMMTDSSWLFDTYNYNVSLLTKVDCFYLHAEPHLFSHGIIAINTFKSDQLQLAIEVDVEQVNDNFKLILEESTTSFEKIYPLEKTLDSLATQIALNDLCTTLYKKQFSIVDDSAEPKRYQFELQKNHLSSTLTTYKITRDFQTFMLTFYKCKNRTLGIKVTKPFVKA